MSRILLIMVLLCFGCQTGRIPCPKPKSKLIRSGHYRAYRAYSSSLTAQIDKKDAHDRSREIKPTDSKYVKNVSAEEWDCPNPGARKYLPRNVKENIRRNARKVEEDGRKNAGDSISVAE
jgi:hypothetical protein